VRVRVRVRLGLRLRLRLRVSSVLTTLLVWTAAAEPYHWLQPHALRLLQPYVCRLQPYVCRLQPYVLRLQL